MQFETKFSIVSVDETYSKYYANDKQTLPKLTKYERAKILGVRAEMIANGAQVFLTENIPSSAYQIALLELQQKKIPLIIRRYLPNKEIEDWRLEDLII